MPLRNDDASGLQWGWWLRVNGRGLEDGEGRTWRSVRDAFWQGLLGFPDIHVAPEQHELMLRVLTAIDLRGARAAEDRNDLFDQNMMFWRFYMCWLSSIGLLQTEDRVSPLQTSLSDLGRSVMLMLQATREPDWVNLPIRSVIDAVRTADHGPLDVGREKALVAFESEVARRPCVFARERLHHSHLVTLTGIGAGARMPVLRVMWSQAFADETARDDFFAWLAERVDRWDDWAVIAYSKGAKALTQRFLSLMMEGGALRPATKGHRE